MAMDVQLYNAPARGLLVQCGSDLLLPDMTAKYCTACRDGIMKEPSGVLDDNFRKPGLVIFTLHSKLRSSLACNFTIDFSDATVRHHCH